MANITLILMKNWVYLLVIVLAVGLVGVNHLRGLEADKSLLKDRIIADLEAKVDSSNKALSLKSESCNIDDKSVLGFQFDTSLINSQTDSVEKELISLAHNVYTPVIKEENSAKEEKKDEPHYLPDNGRLSPALTSLLHKAFCNAEPENSSCVPSR